SLILGDVPGIERACAALGAQQVLLGGVADPTAQCKIEFYNDDNEAHGARRLPLLTQFGPGRAWPAESRAWQRTHTRAWDMLASCRGLELGGLRFTAWQGSHDRRARFPARARAARGSKEPAAAAKTRSPLRLVFVGTEVAPWSKIGGLGDVMRALPTALAKRGHSVITVTPRYGDHPDIRPTGVRVPLQPGGKPGTRRAGTRSQTAELYATTQDGVTHVFVEHPLFLKGSIYAPLEESSSPSRASLSRRGGASMTYMPSSALDPVDQRVRVLCAAALRVPGALFKGRRSAGDPPVVFVCNDWPAALVPLLLRAGRSEAGVGRAGFKNGAGSDSCWPEAGLPGFLDLARRLRGLVRRS
ncbi:hypothetical protein H632_c3298p0, partial [Helicosporidium sp. ATCC 50920]